MIIHSLKELGSFIKTERKNQGLTQTQLAMASGVGLRFIVDLENGKQTLHFGKSLLVISTLGIDILAEKRKYSNS
jgi:y4mF family transcriptional regulator